MNVNADMIGFGTMGATLIAIVGFVLNNSRHEANQRRGIYNRMDEEREDTDKIYVRKDIHDLRYSTIEATVNEIKSDVKKLLQKNGIV